MTLCSPFRGHHCLYFGTKHDISRIINDRFISNPHFPWPFLSKTLTGNGFEHARTVATSRVNKRCLFLANPPGTHWSGGNELVNVYWSWHSLVWTCRCDFLTKPTSVDTANYGISLHLCEICLRSELQHTFCDRMAILEVMPISLLLWFISVKSLFE